MDTTGHTQAHPLWRFILGMICLVLAGVAGLTVARLGGPPTRPTTYVVIGLVLGACFLIAGLSLLLTFVREVRTRG